LLEPWARGAATEFSGFLRMFRELPNIDAILMNPRTEPVPENARPNTRSLRLWPIVHQIPILTEFART